jgi:hypothetical protein
VSAPVLKRVTVTYREDGTIEYAVRYEHTAEPPTPGSKKRVATVATLARKGLQAALEGLGKDALLWGGFGTNTRESTDRIMVDREPRKENAA